MKRFTPGLIMLLLLAITGGATALADGAPVPSIQKDQTVQSVNKAALPGDQQRLLDSLSASGPVKYRILLVDSVNGEDPTAYLDRVAASWGLPPADTLYLVIYTGDNYNLRFYMGANFRVKGVTVDEMLKMTRETYFAKNRQGKATEGLVDLIQAVNKRMAQ
jgi:uncharacterized membrane protein YgcG